MSKTHVLIPVPATVQTKLFDCGAACLRAVATYFGVGPEDEGDYIKAVKAKASRGAKPGDIIAAARRMRMRVAAREGLGLKGLFKALSAGVPVICPVQAWGRRGDYRRLDSGHYVVAIGFDGEDVICQDPYLPGSRGRLPHADFLERWVDKDADGREYRQLGIAAWLPGGPHGDGSRRTKSRRIK